MNQKFAAAIMEDGLVLSYNGKIFLKNIFAYPNITTEGKIKFIADSIEEKENIIIHFKIENYREWCPQLKFLDIVLHQQEDTMVLFVDAQTIPDSGCFNFLFQSEDAISLHYDFAFSPKGAIEHHGQNPFWLNIAFETNPEKFNAKCESVLVQSADENFMFLPINKDCLYTFIDKNEIKLSTGMPDYSRLSGAFLAVSAAKDPYQAVRKCFEDSKKLGAIDVLLKSEKKFPIQFEGFGWCTWNAFYTDVSSEKIYQKLDELKQKGIQVDWLLIDDGWSSYTPMPDAKLLSFQEDKQKFPEGLSGCIQRIKEKYGVKYVGVWHAFTGYWNGVSKDGELYKQHRDLLFESPSGWVLPGETEEKSFAFWNTWHSYLKQQGVDFVKVDNQSAFLYKFENVYPRSMGTRYQHNGIEKSVFKNFDGAMINCMGEDMVSNQNRALSMVNRNSDDYFPNREDGFMYHIVQNVYNAVVHDELHNCDFDMWWSEHESAMQSAVLRAVSGGPIYVSDEVGRTNAKYILPLLKNGTGETYRLENAAKPTYDCLYTDCVKENKPLKIFNTNRGNIVVACFGLSEKAPACGVLKLSDIPGADGAYIAHNYFEDCYITVDKNTEITLSLSKGDVALWSFYPLKDGKAMVGDPTKYAEIAAEPYKEMKQCDVASDF